MQNTNNYYLLYLKTWQHNFELSIMLLPGHFKYTRCIFIYYYVYCTTAAYPGSLNTLSLSSMSNTLASPVSLYLSINCVIRSCCDVTSTSHWTRNRALSTIFFRWTCPILPTPNRAAPSGGVEVIWSKWNLLVKVWLLYAKIYRLVGFSLSQPLWIMAHLEIHVYPKYTCISVPKWPLVEEIPCRHKTSACTMILVFFII